MNVWKVYCNYDSGDHEKGYYESPLFLRREDAEKFLKDLDGRWDEKPPWGYNEAYILISDIKEGPVDVGDPEQWLHIVFT